MPQARSYYSLPQVISKSNRGKLLGFLWWLSLPRLVITGVRSVILPGRVSTPETHVLPRKGLTIVYFLWVLCVLHHFNQSDYTLFLWKCGILTLWISNKIACSDWPTKQKRSQWSLFILRKNIFQYHGVVLSLKRNRQLLNYHLIISSGNRDLIINRIWELDEVLDLSLHKHG